MNTIRSVHEPYRVNNAVIQLKYLSYRKDSSKRQKNSLLRSRIGKFVRCYNLCWVNFITCVMVQEALGQVIRSNTTSIKMFRSLMQICLFWWLVKVSLRRNHLNRTLDILANFSVYSSSSVSHLSRAHHYLIWNMFLREDKILFRCHEILC